MKRLSLLAISAIALGAAAAHAGETKPGNCAIWAEESSKTVAADARFEGETKTSIVAALDSFAKAQRSLMESQMEQAYKDAAAFGWDKAKVDAMTAQSEDAMRKGFRTSTMAPNKLYMDHLMKLNGCIQANPNDSQYGMPRADFIAALEKSIPIVRGG